MSRRAGSGVTLEQRLCRQSSIEAAQSYILLRGYSLLSSP